MNNCEKSLRNGNLDKITILFGQDATNNYKLDNYKFQINYNKNQDNQDIIVYEPNKTPKFIDKDIFLEDGLILFNESCRIKVCKTWNSGICKKTSSLLKFGIKKNTSFENSLISLKNKRNNKNLKKFILKRFIDDSFNEIDKNLNKFTRNLEKREKANQTGGDVSLPAIIALIPFIGFCLTMLCKLITKKNQKNDCWKWFKRSLVLAGFIFIIIFAVICAALQISCFTTGSISSNNGNGKGNVKTNISGGSNNNINFKDIIKLLKQRINKENISMNTHYFQLKNINKVNQNSQSTYFLQVQFKKFSKQIKVCRIIYVKDINVINSNNYSLDTYMNKLESIKNNILNISHKKGFNMKNMPNLQNQFDRISYEVEKNTEQIIVNEEQKEEEEE